MRRLLVALLVTAAVVAALLLPAAGARQRPARSVEPFAKVPAHPTKTELPALSPETLALVAGRQQGLQGSPPCFRDSPGGRCVTVCVEALRQSGPAPPCPPRAPAGRLVPVSARP